MDIHELVKALKVLAEQLGSTPYYEQAKKHIKSYQHKINVLGIRHSELIEMAGLAPTRTDKPPKITNDIFKKNIEEHLQEAKPKLNVNLKRPKILVLGDCHFPFINQLALDRVHEFGKAHQPDVILQIGDVFDMYSHSKFPRSHNLFTPKEEESKAKEMAARMWKRFADECPGAKRVQIVGNHDVRPMKRALEAIPTMEHWIEAYLKELLSFDGVTSILDSREEYVIEDVTFIHGHLTGIGRHRDYFLNNIVCGHTHTGGVSYRQVNGKIIWELNCGYLGDQNSKGLSYTQTKTVLWTLGFGYIDEYGPRFIPL